MEEIKCCLFCGHSCHRLPWKQKFIFHSIARLLLCVLSCIYIAIAQGTHWIYALISILADLFFKMDWKETVTNISDKVFPGLSFKIDRQSSGNEVMSNLPLQMSLYFNAVFTPVWCIVMILFLDDNYTTYDEIYKFLSITIIIAVLFIEMLRIFLGYEGNLRDKIPELAGFWMISVLIQLPLQGFLLFNPYFKLGVLETVVQSTMFVMLCAQLISGYIALRYTAKQQTTYFRIMKLRSDVTLADIQERYKAD